MKPVTKIVAAALVAGSLWFCLHERRLVTRQRNELEVQRQWLATAERQVADWHARQVEADRALAAAQQDIDAHAREDAASAVSFGAHTSQINSWIGRVKQLRALLVQQPDQLIPELRLLTDLDWLGLAQKISGLEKESDVRSALALVRATGKEKFAAQQLAPALRKFAAANDGTLPTDVLQLLSYFDAPIDPAILQRYEMRQSGKVAEASPRDHAIVERAAIDADYDARVYLNARGGFGSSSPWRSSEMADEVSGARQRFAAANNGQQPQNPSDILPYITSPVVRGVMAATADYQNAHGGRTSSNPADFLPYAKDPATRAEIEHLIEFRARQTR